MNKRQRVDIKLALSIIFLMLWGMVMVFSASSMMANSRFGSLTFFFQRQLLWGFLSFVLMIAFSMIDYKKYRLNQLPLFGILVTILLLVGLFVLGVRVNGARRWYHLYILNFQPSELAKLTLILYFAYYLSSPERNIKDLKKGFLPLMAVLALVLLPVVLQPDLSTSLMLALIAGSMLLVSQAKLRHLAIPALLTIPGVLFLLNRPGYQLRRVTEWLAGLHNPVNAGYQIKQSLIGLGQGGWFGLGLAQSKQKFFFLPDSHTDFIFSILGEEFGFLGTTVVLIVFLFILYRGMYIARKAPDSFGKFLAIGITLDVVLYAYINAGVVSMLFPATGLPMPFISYGGSHLLFLGVAMGILLNISRHTQPAKANWEGYANNQERFRKTILTVD